MHRRFFKYRFLKYHLQPLVCRILYLTYCMLHIIDFLYALEPNFIFVTYFILNKASDKMWERLECKALIVLNWCSTA